MCVHFIRSGMPVVLALALCLGGCKPNTTKIDISEIRDPMIRKAKARADQGDRDGALACLNQALERRPDLAQAHLDAGLLYDEYKKDYVRAAYHYQRYLELRPATEKKAMIEEMIRKCRLSFAASVSDQLPGSSEKFQALQDENERLKKDLLVARENAAKRNPAPGQTAKTDAPQFPANQSIVARDAQGSAAAETPTVPPGAQLYRVQEHETLTLIATKMYRNPGKWKTIFEANRQTLESPERLRPGQLLIIPR